MGTKETEEEGEKLQSRGGVQEPQRKKNPTVC